MVEFNEPIGFLERLKYKLKIIKPFPPYSEIETKESNNQRKPWELTQEQLDNTGKHRETVVQSNSKLMVLNFLRQIMIQILILIIKVFIN